MVLDTLPHTQASQLFLAEALELCQQVKEGLLMLAHAPTPLTHQTLVRRVQTIRQGARHVGLMDIQLLVIGLESLLATCELTTDELTPCEHAAAQPAVVQELLHHLCDGLQLSLIAHRSLADTTTGLNQRGFVLHSLVPKALEVFEAALALTLPDKVQSQLLTQQAQWMQIWSQALDLTELGTIAVVTLTTFKAFPQATIAIAQVALAGFQVAYEATLQRLVSADAGLIQTLTAPDQAASSIPQPLLYPSEQALAIFNTGQHLVGLAHQTVFCVATESIEEIVLLEPSHFLHEDGREQIRWRDRLLMLHRFIDLWQPSEGLTPPRAETKSLVLVLRHDSQPLALALDVDRLIVEPELKLNQPDPSQFEPHRCCYGLTCLDEGSWVEVVDVNGLLCERSSAALSSNDLVDRVNVESQRPVALTATALDRMPPEVSSLSPKTILIVDDSRTVRELLTLTLREAGYTVLQAQDGQEAISHLQHQANIHLTICDIEMSNLNGFEFLRHRLQDERWGHIPVLILSSHTGDEYRQLAQKLGAADYFTIPYDPPKLLTAIERLLQSMG